MGKQITVEPVSRIEGHAKITVNLNDSGAVDDAHLHIVEMRGFEKLLQGRPVEDAQRIVTAICGICPVSHHLASAKAADNALGVEIPRPAALLRELMHMGQYIHSHTLHFFYLAAPDLIFTPDGDPKKRNVFGVIEANPELATQAVLNRKRGQEMIRAIGGRAAPVTAKPGGLTKGITEEQRQKMLQDAQDSIEFTKLGLEVASPIFEQYLDVIKTLGVVETPMMGLVKDGNLELYDGTLRMMDTDGSIIKEFDPTKYAEYIQERYNDWTYLKFPYWKEKGWPDGIYRVAPLARINVCDKISTPLANDMLTDFRKAFGRMPQQTLLYHYARLIELMYASERAIELLNDPDITSADVWAKPEPREATGVGVLEAPRGTLIHEYTTDNEGFITKANLIVSTGHNQGAMDLGVREAAKGLIKDGEPQEGLLNRLEMVVRAYDPCFSCATHTIDGRWPIKLELVEPNGRTRTYTNY
ncbi:MAG TPA: Ni/Fe hydrogenase subunit alpha [Candidatus Bathyarchaeia archaeon]|nr:Ni/Fe hydrogenase subunit alpha [Candidatus Bathyarchaeia archaeon]